MLCAGSEVCVSKNENNCKNNDTNLGLDIENEKAVSIGNTTESSERL